MQAIYLIISTTTAVGSICVCTTEKRSCLAEITLEVMLLPQDLSKYPSSLYLKQNKFSCNNICSALHLIKIYAVSTQFMPLGLKEWITSVCVLRKEGELVADMMLKIWACPTLSSSFHLEQNAAQISNELTNDLII